MYICICNAVTESQIRQAVDEGVSTLAALKTRLGVAASCGSCLQQADETLHKRLLEITAVHRIVDLPASRQCAQ
ncbi:MAG: (2Fe-2S)-binding protein [Gammaproteobacteria bacterium]